MACIQAKTGWERPRKSENFNVPIISYPTRYRQFQKNSKKIKKINRHHYGLFPSEPRLGKPKKG